MATYFCLGPIKRKKPHSNLTKKVKCKELITVTGDWNDKALASKKRTLKSTEIANVRSSHDTEGWDKTPCHASQPCTNRAEAQSFMRRHSWLRFTGRQKTCPSVVVLVIFVGNLPWRVPQKAVWREGLSYKTTQGVWGSCCWVLLASDPPARALHAEHWRSSRLRGSWALGKSAGLLGHTWTRGRNPFLLHSLLTKLSTSPADKGKIYRGLMYIFTAAKKGWVWSWGAESPRLAHHICWKRPLLVYVEQNPEANMIHSKVKIWSGGTIVVLFFVRH